MRHFFLVLISALAILPLAAREETSLVFTPVMTSTATPSRRALIVIPAFSGGGMTPRGALAGSDALAYRDTLRLLGFSGMVVSAITRPALRDAIRGFADSVPHDAEVAVFVLGAVIPAGGKLYVPPSDVLPSDRTPERIPTAGLDLAAILNVIGGRGPKEVVAIVDECGGGEAKPACEIGPSTIPDGVSAIVARRVPTPSGGDPVAGIATVRQELLPLMREPGLDVLDLYGRLKTKLAGTNDGVVATAALSRSFAFMPADFLAGLPIECNRVDPATPADTLRRSGSMAPLVSSCERAAATYDFSPFFKEKLSIAREQLAFQKAVAGCGGGATAAYLDAYPGGNYRFAVDEHRSSCEGAAQPPAPVAQPQSPASATPDAQDQSADDTRQTQPKQVYVIDDVPGSVLNLRDGPGIHFRMLAAMPAGSEASTEGECRKEDPSDKLPWCQVTWRGVSGWASACCFAPKASVTTNDGAWGIFEVPDNVPGGMLNLRASASYKSRLVTPIPAGSKYLRVQQCRMPSDHKGRPYCRIRWQSFDGWASSYYLEPSVATQAGDRR